MNASRTLLIAGAAALGLLLHLNTPAAHAQAAPQWNQGYQTIFPPGPGPIGGPTQWQQQPSARGQARQGQPWQPPLGQYYPQPSELQPPQGWQYYPPTGFPGQYPRQYPQQPSQYPQQPSLWPTQVNPGMPPSPPKGGGYGN
jgi:hypothetical protein